MARAPYGIGLAFALIVATSCSSKSTRPSYAETIEADAPSSYWRFGEPLGATVAHDQRGIADAQIAQGALPGQPGAIAGDSDTAFSFDGQTGAVIGPDIDTFDGTKPFSVEVWIAPHAGGLPIQRICNHRVGPPHVGWRMFVDEAKHVSFERWDQDKILSQVSAPLSLDVYAHVVARYDGQDLALYVNGQPASRAHDTQAIEPFQAALVWGSASTHVLDFFTGRLDEGAIYDHALDESRIVAHYRAGVGP